MQATKTGFRNSIILGNFLLGLSALRARSIRQRGQTITRIVTFHKIKDVARFERQIQLLASRYHVVSMRDYADGRVSKTAINVVVTLDDGYRSWLLAAPILQRYGVPAVFFVSSGYIDAGMNGQWADFCTTRMGVQPVPSLSWDEVRMLAQQEGFEIGGHTVHHPCVGGLSDPRQIEREIVDDKRRLEEQLEMPMRWFAYPYGHQRSFNRVSQVVVRQAGYECACTLLPGVNGGDTDPFLLHRDCLDDVGHPLLMRAWLAGGYDLLKQRLVAGQVARSLQS